MHRYQRFSKETELKRLHQDSTLSYSFIRPFIHFILIMFSHDLLVPLQCLMVKFLPPPEPISLPAASSETTPWSAPASSSGCSSGSSATAATSITKCCLVCPAARKSPSAAWCSRTAVSLVCALISEPVMFQVWCLMWLLEPGHYVWIKCAAYETCCRVTSFFSISLC